MKFHWFAQQYYTKLPPDYGDVNRSSWVTAPINVADPVQVGEDYHMYLRLMQQADGLGWDSLLLNEHHQTSLAMTPSPNLIASILAATTENAAIALCGNSLALYNPPIRVAEEIAMLDCLSGGRIIAGIVFGTPMDTAFSYGVPPIELRERFHEARDLITRAWQAEEPFAFNGKYTQLRYVNTWPRPVQEDIPVWIPGSGSPETWDVVNALDYCYGYLSFSGKQSAEPIVKGFWDYTESQGGNMNPNRMAFTQVICCADTDEEAERQYSEAVKYFYRQNPTAIEFATPPGYNTPASIRSTLNRAKVMSDDERRRATRGELSFWEYDELGYIIAGTPDRVAQRVRELATDLRIGQLITCMHVGNLPEEVAAENNRLFGTEVMPQLRDLWADQEDRWTPKVSQERVAAKFGSGLPQ
ncbi:LLM class flavin-dependent oxidoreductase [Geodermatophilus ruber]|uniref:Flavin-dependent oxidoreductase, luciferase family (Includes alkanesulfonate monooxygenase SsuD and methylene tetrahydromethanopterin reductase) n=1 Tax=Geodermatophilus ruber TaxID=504800 RepID=A0A1I4AHX7_9ACTN|nr:LLM class flavin-dependent oxidoreductase [Geodermatophilus ruber]SFK55984.1 Flavin-dependent oxidoreductase, luciferase family (includes alkanesulfonate monooxygenase SsuD and methylene tetrahydromethanopterin reductase) [Geodermatophilus ruber]